MISAELTNRAWAILNQIPDPEIPVISVCELGIVREVVVTLSGIEVILTPTYFGCPATEQIEQDICCALESEGLGPVHIRTKHFPVWTTDWISDIGKHKLHAYGIAPPGENSAIEKKIHFIKRGQPQPVIACPYCLSKQTELLAAFGSTACKALYRCLSCREPFEYFKPI